MPTGYKKFEQSVLTSAEKQAKQIIINAQKYRSDALRGLNVVPSDELERRIDIINQRADHRIAKTEQDQKRDLLIYRGELCNSMFLNIEQKLADLTTNLLFKQNMANCLQKLSPEIGKAVSEGSDMLLLAKKSDCECFKNLLSDLIIRFDVDYDPINASEHITIAPDDGVKIGGFVLKIGRLRFDCTLDTAIERERTRFYGNEEMVL